MRSPLEEELKEKLLAFAKSRDISQVDLASAGFDDVFFDSVAQHPISKVTEILAFLDAKIQIEVKGNKRAPRTFAEKPTPPTRPLTWEDLRGALNKYPSYKWAVAFQQHIDPKDNLAKYDRGEESYGLLSWHTSACEEESALAHRLIVCHIGEKSLYPILQRAVDPLPPIHFPNQRLCDATPIAIYGLPRAKERDLNRRMILMRNEEGEWSPTGPFQEPYFRWLNLMLRPESLFGGRWNPAFNDDTPEQADQQEG